MVLPGEGECRFDIDPGRGHGDVVVEVRERSMEDAGRVDAVERADGDDALVVEVRVIRSGIRSGKFGGIRPAAAAVATVPGRGDDGDAAVDRRLDGDLERRVGSRAAEAHADDLGRATGGV